MANQPLPPPPLGDKIAWMFATPVIGFQWPDNDGLNTDLEALILAKESADQTVLNSNAGGWQSPDDLLSWGEPCTDELKRRVNAMLMSVLRETSDNPNDPPRAKFRLDCWANVNRAGIITWSIHTRMRFGPVSIMYRVANLMKQCRMPGRSKFSIRVRRLHIFR